MTWIHMIPKVPMIVFIILPLLPFFQCAKSRSSKLIYISLKDFFSLKIFSGLLESLWFHCKVSVLLANTFSSLILLKFCTVQLLEKGVGNDSEWFEECKWTRRILKSNKTTTYTKELNWHDWFLRLYKPAVDDFRYFTPKPFHHMCSSTFFMWYLAI